MKVAGETWQRSRETSPPVGSYIQTWIYRVSSHDATTFMHVLVSEMAAMSQTNPVEIALFSYMNTFLYSNTCAWLLWIFSQIFHVLISKCKQLEIYSSFKRWLQSTAKHKPLTSRQGKTLQFQYNELNSSPFDSRKSAKAFCLPNLAPAGMFGPNGGTSFERLTATLKKINKQFIIMK